MISSDHCSVITQPNDWDAIALIKWILRRILRFPLEHRSFCWSPKALGIILSKNPVFFPVVGSLTVGACWLASSHECLDMLGQNLGFCPLSFFLLQLRWGPGVRCCWGHCSRDGGRAIKQGGDLRFAGRSQKVRGQGYVACLVLYFTSISSEPWTVKQDPSLTIVLHF